MQTSDIINIDLRRVSMAKCERLRGFPGQDPVCMMISSDLSVLSGLSTTSEPQPACLTDGSLVFLGYLVDVDQEDIQVLKPPESKASGFMSQSYSEALVEPSTTDITPSSINTSIRTIPNISSSRVPMDEWYNIHYDQLNGSNDLFPLDHKPIWKQILGGLGKVYVKRLERIAAIKNHFTKHTRNGGKFYDVQEPFDSNEGAVAKDIDPKTQGSAAKVTEVTFKYGKINGLLNLYIDDYSKELMRKMLKQKSARVSIT